MTKKELVDLIRSKNSMLCVGLDPDLSRMPPHLLKEKDPIFSFNQAIIDATLPFSVAYKPNFAFYEAQGLAGWRSLEKTITYLKDKGVFTIADAKRGDIGNTSKMYARAILESLDFDAVTVAPYMGSDSVAPFLGFKNKWVILLALTSNSSSAEFQKLKVGTRHLYEQVLETSLSWGSSDELMYVVGATRAADLQEVRAIIPEHFLLVPGIGAQGGDLEEVCVNGMTEEGGLLINSARGIIYAGEDENFAAKSREAAHQLSKKMGEYLQKY